MAPAKRGELPADLRGLRLHAIRIVRDDGAQLCLCDEASLPAVTKYAEQAMRRGAEVHWPDGRVQWIDAVPDFNPGRAGSAAYTWDVTGNRVRCGRFLCTRTAGGKVTRARIGTVYRKL